MGLMLSHCKIPLLRGSHSLPSYSDTDRDPEAGVPRGPWGGLGMSLDVMAALGPGCPQTGDHGTHPTIAVPCPGPAETHWRGQRGPVEDIWQPCLSGGGQATHPSRIPVSLSPLGTCHPHPLVPTEAPQHPNHPRAHGGAARGHSHLGRQGQVQQEECPGGEQVTAGGTLVPQDNATPAQFIPAVVQGMEVETLGTCQSGREYRGTAGHCPVLMGTERSPRDILAPGGALPGRSCSSHSSSPANVTGCCHRS